MTTREIRGVTAIHLEAFKGYANASLGADYNHAFFEWFIAQSNESVALVAKDQNHKILGYVVGTYMQNESALARFLVPKAIRSLIRQPWLFVDRQILKKIANRAKLLIGNDKTLAVVPPPLEKPTMGLIAVGVDSHARGKGVARALMQGFEKESRERKAKTMLLSVYTDNEAARKLYVSEAWLEDDSNAFKGKALYYFKSVE